MGEKERALKYAKELYLTILKSELEDKDYSSVCLSIVCEPLMNIDERLISSIGVEEFNNIKRGINQILEQELDESN